MHSPDEVRPNIHWTTYCWLWGCHNTLTRNHCNTTQSMYRLLCMRVPPTQSHVQTKCDPQKLGAQMEQLVLDELLKISTQTLPMGWKLEQNA